MRHRFLVCRPMSVSCAVGLAVALVARSLGNDDSQTPTVSFARQVRPIFNEHCIACHGGIKQAAGLSFVYRDLVVGKEDDEKVVIAGDPDGSELLARVSSDDAEERMPPADHGDPLSVEQIEILRTWIAEGAPWEEHWAFAPVPPITLPAVAHPEWCQSGLDHFVLENLERDGRTPNPPADPAAWLRRASFDLVGLPPSESELEEFLSDPSSDARAKIVDRLLASPRFGERWATPWLDLARYADTMGYEKDPPRQIWPYRDWVIRALNDDLPFEEFTVKQLAGDLLPDATIGDRVATAFHRNTQANTEGGTDDEEFRITAVVDRANTTAQVWLGLTLGCAQCHDHPYEPITNAEYYQFLAYFNNASDYDTNEEFPHLAVPYKLEHWADAQRMDSAIQQRQAQQFALVEPYFEPEHWQPATIAAASATQGTELQIVTHEGRSEIRTGAKLVAASHYTLDCQPPANAGKLTAILLEAPPLDVETAAKIPEAGFILSHLRVQLILAAGGEPVEIPLRFAFGDDPDPFYTAADSLHPNLQGWSSYPRQSRTHRAIFVPQTPIDIAPDARLRLILEQHSSSEHLFQIRRLRVAVTSDAIWMEPAWRRELETIECDIADLVSFRKNLNSLSIPVITELPPQSARQTHLLHRGNFLEPKVRVQPNLPRVLAGGETPQSRLELARWLGSHRNPLAARVQVNRVWNELFGHGIVESIENFGSSGLFPSNEPLLNYLADRFNSEYQGRLKPLLREIVLSSTYAQSSSAAPDQWADDPGNRQLARGPRNRLTAEMIRDQALAVSGLLSEKMFGPPVMPPQPEGLWQSAYSGEAWHTATGEDRYRRAVYTYCKRTSGYPGLLTFDAPTRDVCVVRRISTNTPLQALVTLNDPAYVEMAEAFGNLIAQSKPETPRDKIAWGYRRATCQVPTSASLDALESLFQRALEGENVDGKTPDGERQAYAIVASAILNLDEAMNR